MGSWVRLRVDGSIKVDLRYVIVGGVLRNGRGEWIMDFIRKLGRFVPFFRQNYGIF